jgi:hypothetical protein
MLASDRLQIVASSSQPFHSIWDYFSPTGSIPRNTPQLILVICEMALGPLAAAPCLTKLQLEESKFVRRSGGSHRSCFDVTARYPSDGAANTAAYAIRARAQTEACCNATASYMRPVDMRAAGRGRCR